MGAVGVYELAEQQRARRPDAGRTRRTDARHRPAAAGAPLGQVPTSSSSPSELRSQAASRPSSVASGSLSTSSRGSRCHGLRGQPSPEFMGEAVVYRTTVCG